MRSDKVLKYAIALLILSGFLSPALGYNINNFQWGEGTSGKLMRGEELVYDVYTVKAVGFPAPVKSSQYSGAPAESVQPFVMINLSKNGILLNSTPLVQGDYIIAPDGEVKVSVKQLPSRDSPDYVYETYGPWALMEISPRGKPSLEVSVETDYNEYISKESSEISATVTVKNTGSADLFNANLNILTTLPLKSGALKYHYERIEMGGSITESITFATPIVTELDPHEILANVTGYDAKDIFYSGQSAKDILIAPEPEQIPTLKKNVNAKIYLDELAMVSLVFKNNANYELKNVSITDSLPEGFKLVSNNSLHWVVTLPAKAEWDARYLMKPTEASKEGVLLPAGSADFRTKKEFYTIMSNQPTITIYGPKISLTKQIDTSSIRSGDTITVTVVAANIGSAPTKITVIDKLPPEGTLVSGETSINDFVEANKEVRFSYSIRIDSELPVKLPAAIAEYYELGAKTGKLTATSGEPEITIRTPESEAAANAENATPSFEITAVQETPAPTPELPFTPIIEEEEQPVPVETPASVITPVPVSPQDIDSTLNFLLRCDANGITDNGSYIACSLIKKP